MYNVVENPIKTNSDHPTLTPDLILRIISALPMEHRESCEDVFYMTMNACNRLVNEEILSKDIFI